MNVDQSNEPNAIKERYARRNVGNRYSFLNPEVWLATQERQRVMLILFSKQLGLKNFNKCHLTEVGCGSGGNLLEFLRLGFSPENLYGIELLEDRVKAARKILPAKVNILEGDANRVNIECASQDIVFQSVVFSSLLDDHFQAELASRMWQWIKPGGGVLWYDFIYDNPHNPDVRGIKIKRIRELFPEGNIIIKHVTLAPPISRRVCKIHPSLYHLFNVIPLLRTHVLCWIQKSS